MRLFLIGRRSSLFQRYQVLLHEDRLEEVSYTTSSQEVTRLFFDEVQAATVHRGRNWPYVAVLGFFTFWMLLAVFGASLGRYGMDRVVGLAICIPIAAALLAATIYVATHPPHELTLRTPDQTMTVSLSRGHDKREEAIAKLIQAVEDYQARHGAAEPPIAVSPIPSPPAV